MFISRRLFSSKALTILYGSHTGTSANYANTISLFAQMYSLETKVLPLDSVKDLPDGKTVIVCSTTGNGELPANAQRFYQWLRDTKPDASRLSYAIFGLGNSSYDLFNNGAKILDSALQDAGASRLLDTGLGDENAKEGHQNAFQPWLHKLWGELGASGETLSLPEHFKIGDTTKPVSGVVPPQGFHKVHVLSNTLLTAKDYPNEVRLLQIATKGSPYELLGHIHVIPQTSKTLVDRCLMRLGLDGDKRVEITPTSSKNTRIDHCVVSIRQLFSEYLDISAVPSRSLLAGLAICAQDAQEKLALERLSTDTSPGNEYTNLASAGVFTLVDALERFRSVNISLGQLLSCVSTIQPRAYSIASDPLSSPESMDIAFGVQRRGTFKGLATGFMQGLKAGDSITVQILPGTMKAPSDDVPIVGVSLGTGIAPLRALLQRRAFLHQKNKPAGKILLYYGMRHRSKDFLFADEIKQFEKDGVLELQTTFSHDQPRFITPLDSIDERPWLVNEMLQKGAIFYYVGLGGIVPKLVEGSVRDALAKCGATDPWDALAALRRSGRYHEEHFEVDMDAENRMKELHAREGIPMQQRFADSEMFCFQCEQTFQNTGCVKTGVCGKTPDVAYLQDLVVHSCKVLGWYLHHYRLVAGDKAVDQTEINRWTLYSMFSTLTNVNFDAEAFILMLRDSLKYISIAKGLYLSACSASGMKPDAPIFHLPTEDKISMDHLPDLVANGKLVGVLAQYERGRDEAAIGICEMLIYGLKGLCAYADHASLGKVEDPVIFNYVNEALAFLMSEDRYDAQKGLQMCLRCGEVNVTALGALYQSNSQYGIPQPRKVPALPTPGKCILISGHDMVVLASLLKAIKGTDIKVYTHGEMLPGHSYPKLFETGNLHGHYGGPWNRQSLEFPHFPGPIVMTTNCLTEPKDSYRDRLFNFGAVGWNGIQHLGNDPDSINWKPVIDKAMQSEGFTQHHTQYTYPPQPGIHRPDSYMVGFGHEAVLAAAPVILDQVNKGNITRFYAIGGCDGYEGTRNYFTDVTANLPPTSVVLTFGCGKFRVNHLDLGTIGDTGIPRILDMGQCNDSFSAVQVAMALKTALNCDLNDLPLSYVISWFEQKAVSCFLSLLFLGVRKMRLGPSLPAFVNPAMLKILNEQFGVFPTADVHADVKDMASGVGCA